MYSSNPSRGHRLAPRENARQFQNQLLSAGCQFLLASAVVKHHFFILGDFNHFLVQVRCCGTTAQQQELTPCFRDLWLWNWKLRKDTIVSVWQVIIHYGESRRSISVSSTWVLGWHRQLMFWRTAEHRGNRRSSECTIGSDRFRSAPLSSRARGERAKQIPIELYLVYQRRTLKLEAHDNNAAQSNVDLFIPNRSGDVSTFSDLRQGVGSDGLCCCETLISANLHAFYRLLNPVRCCGTTAQQQEPTPCLSVRGACNQGIWACYPCVIEPVAETSAKKAR